MRSDIGTAHWPGIFAMQPPRHYGALRETQIEADERAAEPVPTRPAPTLTLAPALQPDGAFQARHRQTEQKVAYADDLQARVNDGSMSREEKMSRLDAFDRREPDGIRDAQALREARELAAEVRSHEAADKAREREGPER